jgi:hypothetical protein
MSENLTAILDRMQRTIDSLLAQFKGQPNMAAIAASYGVQFQEVEDMFIQLYLLRALATAEGEQLDQIGIIVDEPRGDKDDDNYRAAIYGRIALNRSHARIEDIIFAMTSINEAGSYELREIDNATFMMRLKDAIPATLDPETFNDALQRIKGGGVQAHFQYCEEDDEDSFTWADGDVEQTDVDQGWAGVLEITGGSWTDVVE